MRDSKRIVFTTWGSFGDIHPFMGLALELQARAATGRRLQRSSSIARRSKGPGSIFIPCVPIRLRRKRKRPRR